MTMATEETAPETLRELIARHSARFEVHPHREFSGEHVVRVGFDLHLYGLLDDSLDVAPGCAECLEVYEALREVSDWILPPDHRPSRYDIEPFDRALHVVQGDEARDEIRLVLRILHRDHFFQPIDACEERCLGEMTKKLKLLGAREGPRRPVQ